MKYLALSAVLLACSGSCAFAAGSPFDGTWKLDTAKSKFTGDTLTYTKTPTGFRISEGGVFTYPFAIDGKEYPTALPEHTVAWTQTPGGYDVVFKNKGVVTLTSHRTLSADGSKLMSSSVEHRPDGSSAKGEDVYTRVSGSGGLAGEWKSVKAQVSGDTIMIGTPSPGHFTFAEPGYKLTVAGALDGSPSKAAGPTVPPGAFGVYTATSTKVWTYKIMLTSAKTLYEGEMGVSSDGKTLTDTTWIPGRRSEAAVAIYDKS